MGDLSFPLISPDLSFAVAAGEASSIDRELLSHLDWASELTGGTVVGAGVL